MAEIIVLICFSLLAILGLADLMHTVKLWILGNEKSCGKYLVLVPDDQNFIKTVLNASEEKKWQGRKYADEIIVVDCLLSDGNREECRRLSEKLEFKIYDKPKLAELFCGQ